MTSEVVVMNSLAVALAADSAATVSDGRDNKVYNSANKLFMLSKFHPVGVMVYNNSSILGVPWETILKMFREELDDTEFDTLEEYGQALLKYLGKSKSLFPAEAQAKFFLALVETLYRKLFDEFQRTFLQKTLEGDDLEDSESSALAKKIILDARSDWNAKEDAHCFADGDVGRRLAGQFSGEISSLAAKIFDGLSLDTEAATALRDLAILAVSKDEILPESFSGVVVAGFGFPVMQVFELGEVFLDRLKYRKPKVEKISSATPSIVKPFAQSEMVDTFLRGINPVFEYRMIRELVSLVVRLPNEVIDGITELTDEQKSGWKERILPQTSDLIRAFVGNLERHRKDNHRGPILQAIINLPIEELAHVAASLVNLNSFQKRMSLGPETVGGPVDVAVISKGDGFIWISRKHYFRRELNHHFFRNYNSRSRQKEMKQTEGENND